MKPAAVRPPARSTDPKPAASATLEPLGPRGLATRRHAVHLELWFHDRAPNFTDREWVVGVAGSAMAAVPGAADVEPVRFTDVRGRSETRAVGVECRVVYESKPAAASIEQLRHVLSTAGYAVQARELRECTVAGCTATALVDHARSLDAPDGWFASDICGRHGYTLCAHCGSIYAMSSSNAIGAAPSVHCEVCSEILVAWGTTKLWTAELVRRADWPRS